VTAAIPGSPSSPFHLHDLLKEAQGRPAAWRATGLGPDGPRLTCDCRRRCGALRSAACTLRQLRCPPCCAMRAWHLSPWRWDPSGRAGAGPGGIGRRGNRTPSPAIDAQSLPAVCLLARLDLVTDEHGRCPRRRISGGHNGSQRTAEHGSGPLQMGLNVESAKPGFCRELLRAATGASKKPGFETQVIRLRHPILSRNLSGFLPVSPASPQLPQRQWGRRRTIFIASCGAKHEFRSAR
jgi:hypothetical protein